MKHIDNLFKDELGSYAEIPPPPAWDSLEKRLNERRRRKFPYGWFWYVGVVSCIVLLGASLLWRTTWGVPANTTNAGLLASNAIPVSSKQTTENEVKDHDMNSKEKNNIDVATNNKNHSNQSPKHHNNQSLPTATSKNGVAHHTSKSHNNTNKNKNNDQIKATQKTPTNEDLYADEDDDQYTVGYSSSARKNNTPAVETGKGADYVVQQRTHDHILVAEMAPTQQSSEAVYGSNVSNTASDEKLAFQSRNSKIALLASRDKSIAVHHAQNKPHRHNASSANRSATLVSAGEKPIGNQLAETKVSSNKKPKTNKEPSPNVLAASSPSVKIIHNKKALSLASSNNRDQAQAKTSKTPEKEKGALVAHYNNRDQAQKKTSKTGVKKKAASNVAIGYSGKDNAIAAVDKSTDKGAPTLTATTTTSDLIANANTAKKAADTKKPGKKITAAGDPKKTTEVTGKASDISVTNAAAPQPGTIAAIDASDKKNANGEKPVRKIRRSYASAADKKNTPTRASIYQAATTSAVKTNKTATAAVMTTDVSNTKSGIKQVASNDKKPLDKVIANGKVNKPVNTSIAATKTKGGKEKVKPAPVVASKATAESGIVRKEQTEKAKKDTGMQRASKKAEAINIPVAKNDSKTIKKAAHKKIAGNNGSNANPAPQKAPVNIFSTSFSNRTIADEAAMIDNLQVNNFTPEQLHASSSSEEILAGTFKQPDLKPAQTDSAAVNPGAMTDSSAKHRAFAKRFEVGVKGGYETGFVRNSANKFVVSPYIQYNINDKFALLTQPAIKESQLGNVNVGTPKSYSNTLSTSHSGVIDSGIVIIYGGGTVTIPMWLREYNYTRTYDSIVKSYNLAHTYTEFELPLLLKYKFYKQLSVYGGVNVEYDKMLSVNEHTYTSGPLIQNKIGATLNPVGAPISASPAYTSVFPAGPSYNGPLYPSPKGDVLRMGYMLGFSYEYKKRWLFDVLVQQAMAKPNYEGGTNTNTPFSLPYFRFTIGYKLTK